MGIFNKIFGKIQDNQNVKPEIAEKMVSKTAKANTFDNLFFKNNVDGTFVFPKYNTIKSIVKISDKTNYKEDLDLDKDDILTFTMSDFETFYSISEPEFEVEDFQSLFNKRELDGLPVISKLKGQDKLIELILVSIENQTCEPLLLSKEIQQQLEKYGFVEIDNLDRTSYIEFISENTSFDDLKSLCNKYVVRKGQTKSVTICNLLDSNIDLPKAYKITSGFIKYIEELGKLYISDIERTIGLIHPLFHQTIWEEAQYANDFPQIERMIKSKLSEKKWETLLEPK